MMRGRCYHPRMKNTHIKGGVARLGSVAFLALASLVFGRSALAQGDQVDRVNALFKEVPQDRRSDLILLPVLAGMEAPPIGVDSIESAALQFEGSSVWAAAEAWATAEPQRKAIDALRQVTEGAAEGRGMSFAQPYGPGGIDPQLIRAKLYTSLGDPPMLAGRRLMYLEAIENLMCLVQVEATRLAGEGKPGEACDLLVRQVYFARQLADRAFLAEVDSGLKYMKLGLSRIRDVAYVDFKGSRLLGPADIERTMKAIQLYDRSYLDPARLRFPEGNHLSAEQLFEQLYEPRGTVREDMFAKTMARMRTAERPLRLFAEASRYESAGAEQADWFETREMIENVFNSWSARWTLSQFDRQQSLPFTWDRLDRARYAVISASTTDMSVLYEDRQEFETEAVGTRHALAVLGYYYELGVFPPTASSVRPRWMEKIEADPFNPNRAVGNVPAMKFFVPVRDDRPVNERDTPQPHEMNIYPMAGVNFALRLREDQFILYSVGRDGMDDHAEDVTDNPFGQTGDYLIWPPVLSLYRTHLIETNQLP